MKRKRTFTIDENIDKLVNRVVQHVWIENEERISYSEALRRIIISSSLVSDCYYLHEGVELELLQ